MDREVWSPNYGLELKSGVGFPVKTGYRMYDPWYTLGQDLSYSWASPVREAES